MGPDPDGGVDEAGENQKPAAARAWASFNAQGGFVKILIGSFTAASTAVLTALVLALPGAVASWVDGPDDETVVAAPENDPSTSAPASPTTVDVQTTTASTTIAPTQTIQLPTTSTSSPPDPGTDGVEPDVDAVVLANQLEEAGFYYLDTSLFAVDADFVSPPSSPGVSYEASNVIDGNLETAWQEGIKGAGELGVGSTLTFDFDDYLGFGEAHFEIVDVYAGWHSQQPCLYERHARPTRVRVDARAAPEPAFGDLFVPVHSAESVRLELPNGRSILRVQLPATSYDSMTLTIMEVEPGESCEGEAWFDDTVISEVQFADYADCTAHYGPYNDDQVAGFEKDRYPGISHWYFPDGYELGDVGC